jgi:hypothetical protein
VTPLPAPAAAAAPAAAIALPAFPVPSKEVPAASTLPSLAAAIASEAAKL